MVEKFIIVSYIAHNQNIHTNFIALPGYQGAEVQAAHRYSAGGTFSHTGLTAVAQPPSINFYLKAFQYSNGKVQVLGLTDHDHYEFSRIVGCFPAKFMGFLLNRLQQYDNFKHYDESEELDEYCNELIRAHSHELTR